MLKSAQSNVGKYEITGNRRTELAANDPPVGRTGPKMNLLKAAAATLFLAAWSIS